MSKLMNVLVGLSTTVLFLASATAVAAQSYRYDYAVDDIAAAGTLGVGYLIFICCAVICGFAVNFLVAYFVYTDAKKLNIDSALLWAVVSFFFTVIGLLIYLLAIRPDAQRAQQGGSKPVSTEGEK